MTEEREWLNRILQDVSGLDEFEEGIVESEQKKITQGWRELTAEEKALYRRVLIKIPELEDFEPEDILKIDEGCVKEWTTAVLYALKNLIDEAQLQARIVQLEDGSFIAGIVPILIPDLNQQSATKNMLLIARFKYFSLTDYHRLMSAIINQANTYLMYRRIRLLPPYR